MTEIRKPSEKTRVNWGKERRLVIPGKQGNIRRVSASSKQEAVYFDISDTVDLNIDKSKDSQLIECDDKHVIIAGTFKRDDKQHIKIVRLCDSEILFDKEVCLLSKYEKLKLLSLFVDIRLVIIPGDLYHFMSILKSMGVNLPSLIWDETENRMRFLVYGRNYNREGITNYKDMLGWKNLTTDEEKIDFMASVLVDELKYDRLKAYLREEN